MHREMGRVKGFYLGQHDRAERLTFMLDFEFGPEGGVAQSFGGYGIDTYDTEKKRWVGTAHGLDILIQMARVLGVRTLAEAPGKVVWCLRDEPRGPILGFESLEVNGSKRFLISDWSKEWGLDTR